MRDTAGWSPLAGERIEGSALVRLMTRLTWATMVLVAWVSLFLAVGAGLFVWVTIRQDAAVAYDLTTQHISPTDAQHPTFGVVEYLLGIFGYFVTPAIIGAVVAGVFVTSSTMSEKRVAKGLALAAKLARVRGKHRKKPSAEAETGETRGAP